MMILLTFCQKILVIYKNHLYFHRNIYRIVAIIKFFAKINSSAIE